MRILRHSEVGAIRMGTLSLLVIRMEITMTTGSVTMEMEVFVQSTIHTYLEVGFDCNKDTNNIVYSQLLINFLFLYIQQRVCSPKRLATK